jgi:hypothetical protein
MAESIHGGRELVDSHERQPSGIDLADLIQDGRAFG